MDIRPLEAMINHNTTEIFFDNLEVPAENLIGEEGKGLRYIMDGMNAERILVASEAVGDGRWFLKKAVDYANSRVVFGRSIGKNQGVQFPLARAYAELEAADMMCRRAAALFDANVPCGADANMAKLLASEACWKAAEAAMQTHGGFSLREGIRHRAQVARGAALSDRADLDEPGARLSRPARARDGAVVLSWVLCGARKRSRSGRACRFSYTRAIWQKV